MAEKVVPAAENTRPTAGKVAPMTGKTSSAIEEYRTYKTHVIFLFLKQLDLQFTNFSTSSSQSTKPI